MTGPELTARRVGALVAAVVVIVVAIGVVLLFGIRPYPDLPTLRDRPDPPVTAQLAYVDYGSDRGGPCLHVVDGVGVDRTVGCSSTYSGDIQWVDDGRLGVRSWDGDGSTVDVIDVDSGAVVETLRDDFDDDGSRGLSTEDGEGSRLTTGREDGRVWVEVMREGAPPERILELDGPASYDLYDVGWSSDGRWVIAVDSAQRVLVVPVSGEGDPRIWTRGAGPVTVR